MPNKLEPLEFKLEKILGFRNMEEKRGEKGNTFNTFNHFYSFSQDQEGRLVA